MRIESILIQNIKGIRELEFPLKSLTILAGENGCGKTSILDAIRAVFDGGHDPALIREGASKGTVILRLDNGTTIKRTITDKTSTLDITTGDGLKVNKPASFVEKLAEGFSYDPIAFLQADKKKRIQFLLEALPIEFLPEEVEQITGRKQSRRLRLSELNQLRQAIYDQRRDTNVEMKRLDSHITELCRSLPEDDENEPDWPAKVESLRDHKTALQLRREALVGQIALEKKDALIDAEAKCREAVNEAQIAFDAAVKAATNAYHALRDEITALAEAAEREQVAEISAEIETVAGNLAAAETSRKAQDQVANTKRLIESTRDQSFKKQQEVDSLSAQLEELDKLKTRVLAECAIPGIDMEPDGTILVNGIELDQLNTQAQYFTAFQIAAQKQGELGFLLCDRVESIVGDNWTEFQEAAAASGFQVLVARSEAGKPLTVTSQEA